ncbi:MAG: formylglycine-generating enzyme family protein [Synechococcaceae cyanobacterium]
MRIRDDRGGDGSPANASGLRDMHGNAWECCADPWHDNDVGAPEDGRSWLDANSRVGVRRLLRGGSWGLRPGGCCSAYRDGNHPVFRLNYVGFRVCCLP